MYTQNTTYMGVSNAQLHTVYFSFLSVGVIFVLLPGDALEIDTISAMPHSAGEVQPYIESKETSFRLEEEVEFLVPASNSYAY